MSSYTALPDELQLSADTQLLNSLEQLRGNYLILEYMIRKYQAVAHKTSSLLACNHGAPRTAMRVIPWHVLPPPS